jgi:SPX domain protein involved in polyphosphate accumulation
MVQFGLYLRSFLYQPWEKHYLDYENLKNALYEIKHELFAAAAVQQESKEELDPKQAYVQFKEELDRNLNKINQFYEETREMCRVELKAVEDVAVYRKRWADADAEKYRKALERTYVQLVILKDFASINYTGFAKLMKKHDKLIKRYVEPLRAMYLKDKVNKKPVFGILQVEAQYLYADLFHDGNRIEAEIALGAALLEDIGETKRSRIAPRAILFSSIDVNQAEERVINESNETHARKKSTEFSMTWMRARLAIMSAGSVTFI